MGKQIKEVNTNIEAKWLVSSKVVQSKDNNLILAAFYSNLSKGTEINGLMVQRINTVTGDIISSNRKDINTSTISAQEDASTDDENDSESKDEKKEREKLAKIQSDEEGFSKYMRFRDIVYTADNGLIILAEKYHSYSYTTTTYSSSMTGFSNTRSVTYQVYECGDLMMSKIDASGNINWLNVLPKEQREVIETAYSNSPSGFSINTGFFLTGFNWPFYASFGIFESKNKLNIIFNDHKKNENILQLGQKVKRVGPFGKSDCVSVVLDETTGKYTRKTLFSNNAVPTAMPRLGSVLGNDFYMIGKEDRLFAKTKIAVAKLTVKD